jgi:hypothetical protein
MDRPHDNKMCPIIWNRQKYGLTILTLHNSSTNYNSKPIFRLPLKKFMNSGAFWSALNLSTIFWERSLYGINRDYKENEKIKGAYLIAFASDLAPICKAWATRCIHKIIECESLEDEVFVEIIVLNETLTNKLVTAIVNHQMEYSVNQNIYTIIDNDRTESRTNISLIVQELPLPIAQELPLPIAQESSLSIESASLSIESASLPINDNTEINSFCVICMSNLSTYAFVPCGHKCICKNCYKRPNFENEINHKCPTCRKNFSMIMQIFES